MSGFIDFFRSREYLLPLLPPFVLLCLFALTAWSGSTHPTVVKLRRRLLLARLRRPGRRVIGLRVWALSRARGGGSWSVEVSFEGAPPEEVALGDGAPCEAEEADAIAAWGRRTAQRFGIEAEIVRAADC